VSPRRQVRVAPSFFERLDELLPEERTASGVPSTTDFLLHEIPTIIDFLADDYERATFDAPDAPGLRILIVFGVLIPQIVIYAELANDGAVEIVWLQFDKMW
jgi:hypothetical protein